VFCKFFADADGTDAQPLARHVVGGSIAMQHYVLERPPAGPQAAVSNSIERVLKTSSDAQQGRPPFVLTPRVVVAQHNSGSYCVALRRASDEQTSLAALSPLRRHSLPQCR